MSNTKPIQTLTTDLWATQIMPRTGQEISDQWLDQGTRVQIISEPWSCVEGGNVFFLAWHPDTDDGPYQYRAKFGDWRQCLA